MKYNTNVRIDFGQDASCFGYFGRVYEVDYSGKVQRICNNFQSVPYETGMTYEPPFRNITDKALQDLIDNLWYLGFRPSSDVDSVKGEIEAIKLHRDDMRKITFNRLGVSMDK